jgi:hypothetical protein
MESFPGWFTAEWVTAVGTVVTALGIVFVWRQTRILFRQFQDDHKRARREKSVELITNWTKNLQRGVSAARKFAERLDDNQTRALFAEETFHVVPALRGLLQACLSSLNVTVPEAKGGMIELDQETVSLVRWQLVSYLNSLEAIMSAWRHNVAERAMIEEEFRFLIDERRGEAAVARFRQAAGGSAAYPAIGQFILKIGAPASVPPALAPTGQAGRWARLWPWRRDG